VEGSLLDLANFMMKLASAIEIEASNVAISVAEAIIEDLAYTTPVDTSRALSSWFATLNGPSPIVGKAHSLGQHGSTQWISAQETIKLAEDVLKFKLPGESIFITNNQHYIELLNQGWSSQQPAGFVERSIIVGRNAISNFKFTVKR
jgi:hypothetical protein